MFKDKNAKLVETLTKSKKKLLISLIHMVVMAIESQKNEEHMLKKKELFKNKIIVNWIEENKIKKMFVETIQHLCTCNLFERGKINISNKLQCYLG